MKLPKQLLISAFTLVLSVWITTGWSQTCTLSGTGTINWNNGTPPSCQEGGNAGGASVIVIPAGVTLNFDSNADTWTGVRIEVFGTLRISAAGQVTINSSIVVKSGGTLRIDSKLNIGSSDGCGYSLAIENGGTADITGGTPDRLSICGTEIARGGTAGCNNDYPNGSPPYCEPTGGFTGPTGFDENGYNSTLPVQLVLFTTEVVGESIQVKWATSKEEGFDYFLIQHSNNGNNFSDLAMLPGAGYDTDTYKEYLYEHNNPVVGINYYRLKAVDLDGSYEYFGPIAQSFSGTRNMRIYPNPTNGEFINVDLNFNPSEGSRLAILNTQGVEVMNMTGIGPSNHITLNALRPGMYMLKFTSRELTEIRKFIVN